MPRKTWTFLDRLDGLIWLIVAAAVVYALVDAELRASLGGSFWIYAGAVGLLSVALVVIAWRWLTGRRGG
jgi:NADH:ubiquinone oxidoreductase subunit 6 (subunit J)